MLRRVFLSLAVAALAALPPAARAQSVFNMPPGQTSLSFVTVGDPGNAPDPVSNGGTLGAVGYTYQMATYDVTLGQYTQFLNAVAATDQFGCYTSSMAQGGQFGGPFPFGLSQNGVSGSYSYSITGGSQAANMPVTAVTWADALRFVNWLDNGQPTSGTEAAGTTESGAYNLSGYPSNINSQKTFLNALATPPHSGSGAPQYFLPTETEWYKAAYYAGGGTNAGYWAFPTMSGSNNPRTTRCRWRCPSPTTPTIRFSATLPAIPTPRTC